MVATLRAATGVCRGQDAAADRLATLRRTVHHFDFEDAEHEPRVMPDYFYRYGGGGGAGAEGFPRFGSMRTDVPSGSCS